MPLVKAFNYALDKLSGLNVPGLPAFEESRQIVFLRNDPKYIARQTYLQGLYKPDIVLIKWGFFKKGCRSPTISFSDSHETNLCCERSIASLSWKNVLSTLEVKLSSPKAPGYSGFTKYTKSFGELQGDRLEPPQPSQPPLPEMAREVYSTENRTFIIIVHHSFCTHLTQSHPALV